MKRIEIVNLFRVLNGIRTAGMTDYEVKRALFSAHLKLYKYAKENDDFYAGLAERFKPEEEADANETYNIWLNEEVDVTIDKIGRDALATEIAKTDTDIYLNALSYLEPILKD